MTEQELKIWFLDKINSCYCVKQNDFDDIYFMIYDINFIRAKKLANILNKNIEYPTEVKGVCLFRQDFDSESLLCDYNRVWMFFLSNFSRNDQEINDLIKGWLEEHDKLKILRPRLTILNKFPNRW